MQGILFLSLTFITPALLTGMGLYIFSQDAPKRMSDLTKLKWSMAIIHTGLLISIILSQFIIQILGLSFPWHLSIISAICFLVSVGIAFFLIRQLGIWYGLSALIQQFTILSVAFFSFSLIPFWSTLLLIVPIFAFGHMIPGPNRWLRLFLLLVWGCLAVWIFYMIKDPYIVAALHTLLGAILIKKGIAYPELKSI